MDFSIVDTVVAFFTQQMLEFYNSGVFFVLRIILAVYCLVLLTDVILLIYSRGVGNSLKVMSGGANVPKSMTTGKKKFQARWEKIKRRLVSEDDKDYKLSIIEADREIEALLRGLSYKGENLGEILDSIPNGQMGGVEEAKQAHLVHNRVIHDENLVLSRKEAREAMENYEKVLEFLDII